MGLKVWGIVTPETHNPPSQYARLSLELTSMRASDFGKTLAREERLRV